MKTPRRPAAVLTAVRDEDVFLPFWIRYVSRYFSPDEIHVIDHGSSIPIDGDFVTYQLEGPRDNWAYITNSLMERYADLQQQYEYVLLLDVDEVAIADPNAYDGLRDYINRCSARAIQLEGRAVFHEETESPLDLTRPVLSQRREWAIDRGYSKPVLASAPLRWSPGQHNVLNGPALPDPELVLVHLRKMDRDLWRRRRGTNDQSTFAPDGPLELIPTRFRTAI